MRESIIPNNELKLIVFFAELKHIAILATIMAQTTAAEKNLRRYLAQCDKFPEAIGMSKKIESLVPRLEDFKEDYPEWKAINDSAAYRAFCEKIRKKAGMELESGTLGTLVIKREDMSVANELFTEWGKVTAEKMGMKQGGGNGEEIWSRMRTEWRDASQLNREALIRKWQTQLTKENKRQVHMAGYLWAKNNDRLDDIEFKFDRIFKDLPKMQVSKYKSQSQNIDIPVNAIMLIVETAKKSRCGMDEAWQKVVLLSSSGNMNKSMFETNFNAYMGYSIKKSNWTDHGDKNNVHLPPYKRTPRRLRETAGLVGLTTYPPGTAGIIFLNINSLCMMEMTKVIQNGESDGAFGSCARAIHHFLRQTHGVQNQHNVDGNAMRVKVVVKEADTSGYFATSGQGESSRRRQRDSSASSSGSSSDSETGSVMQQFNEKKKKASSSKGKGIGKNSKVSSSVPVNNKGPKDMLGDWGDAVTENDEPINADGKNLGDETEEE